jgi:proteasome lid subunit RPN8/RPN11
MLAPRLRRLAVPRAVYTAMLAQAEAERPLECCGLLAGTLRDDGTGLVEERYPLVNALASPTEYLSDPTSTLAAWRDRRRRGLEELGVYHSHPTSAPIPSRKDLERSYGPEVVNLIISLTTTPSTVRGWWLTDDTFTEAEWSVV